MSEVKMSNFTGGSCDHGFLPEIARDMCASLIFLFTIA